MGGTPWASLGEAAGGFHWTWGGAAPRLLSSEGCRISL